MAERKGFVVAIDGPSGVGKTTVSRLLAGGLGYRYINTGSMYRAVALAANEAGVDLSSDDALKDFCSRASISYDAATGAVIINGKDYTPWIREQYAGELASKASARAPVREFLVAFQRSLGASGSVVMEGRDIGTAVFPDADLKVFLDASHEVRAKRRHEEVKEKNTGEEVSREIAERDRRDTQREHSPLKMAQDALYIDTGNLTPEEVVRVILNKLRERS